MLNDAIADYNLDRKQTIMVGDRDSDREAAKRANVKYYDAKEFFNRD
jgi:histidinol phosphatase-like enzyme